MKKINLSIISFLFLTIGIVVNSFSQTATYTVTKTTDPNPNLYNNNDSLCAPEMLNTLQWAIRKSIDDGIPSTIVFAIPGTGTHIIYLDYEPPTIVKGDLTIDGTTQPGYQGTPLVIIDGQNKVERGLYFHDYSNYTVRGLGIKNCKRRGILFEYATNILAEYNLINRINNNETYTGTAIRIVGNPKIGHTNAIIRYNYFGTDASLNATLGCDDGGILIGPYANNNLISGNTIAYNHQAGIYINSATQNKLSQNLIFGQDSAIVLANGGNNNKVAPDSLLYNKGSQILSGIAEPFDSIEVFGSTGPENANEYLASTQADGNGIWNVQVPTYDYLVATATNINNTSVLSLIKTCITVCFSEQGTIDCSVTPNNLNGDCEHLTICLGQPVTLHVCEGCGGTDDIAYFDFGGAYQNDIYNLDYVGNNGFDDIWEYTFTPTQVGTFDIYIYFNLNPSSEGFGPFQLTVVEPPVISISGNNEICYGEQTDFTVASNGVINNVSWAANPNDPSLVGQQNNETITVSPTVNTTYTVQVLDENGCISTEEITVIVNPLPTPTINGATSFCTGGSTILDAGSGYASYSWNTGTSSQSINITSPGTYSVTVTDANGCTGDAQVQVTENPQIIITPTIVNANCPDTYDGSISLSVSGGTPPYDYSWSNGATTSSISSLGPGSYIVTITDDNNCTRVRIFNIYSNPAPNASISGPTDVCTNNYPVILTASGGGSYQWNTGATSSSISVNPPLNTSSVYTVTVGNAYHCTNTATIYVTPEEPPVINFNAPLVCLGSGIQYILTASTNPYPPNNYDFTWSTGQTDQGVYSSDISISQGGNYTVTVTDNICTVTASTNVAEDPAMTLSIVPTDVSCSCSGQGNVSGDGTITVSTLGGTQPYNFNWTGPNGFTSTSNLPLTDLCEGTYSVTVTDDAGCSVTENTTVNTVNPGWFNGGNDYHLTGNTSWTGNMYISSTIYVEPPYVLNINGAHIEFSETGRIVVRQNGKLLINNSTLTNYAACGRMWPGIYVAGSYQSQNVNFQGYCRVYGNSTIENAKNAIYAQHGAIIYANNTTFHNNHLGIQFIDYPTIQNISYVKNCHFTIDALLLNNYSPSYQLNVVNNIFTHFHVSYNTFVSTALYPYYNRGTAIRSYLSTIFVDHCNFNNVTRGILASTPTVFRTTDVRNNTFSGTYNGIRSEGFSNLTNILYNDFDIPYQTGFVTWGTYLNGTNRYRVWDNNFNNGSVGLYMYNVGSNKYYFIYKNLFQSQNLPTQNGSGFIAIKENHPFLVCNTFDNNDFDISVLEGKIAETESDPINSDHSTKNLFLTHFNGNNCTTGDNAITVQNSAGGSFASYAMEYWYNTDDLFDVTYPDNCITSSIVTLQSSGYTFNYNDPNECGLDIPLLASKSSIAEYEQVISQTDIAIEQKEDSLSTLVDGGDTPGLLSEVLALTPKNYNQTAADLMNAAPYLSDTVLLTFMQNTIHRPPVKTNVLIANSPLPEHLKAEIDNTNLPQHFKDLLWQYQNGINPREQMEQEIIRLQSVNDLYENGLIGLAIDKDTIPTYMDSLITYLESRDDYRAKLQLVPILIAHDDFTEAQNQLSDLDNMTLNFSATERQYIMDYIDLQNLSIQMQPADLSMQDSLIAAHAVMLQSIAGNTDNPYSVDATLLLQQAGLDTLIPPTPLPEVMSNKSLDITPQKNHTIKSETFLDIFPNPANNKLTVIYTLPDEGPYRMAVFDMKGKLQLSQPVTKQYGMLTIPTDRLQPGNYIISATPNKQPSEISKQFTVVY